MQNVDNLLPIQVHAERGQSTFDSSTQNSGYRYLLSSIGRGCPVFFSSKVYSEMFAIIGGNPGSFDLGDAQCNHPQDFPPSKVKMSRKEERKKERERENRGKKRKEDNKGTFAPFVKSSKNLC